MRLQAVALSEGFRADGALVGSLSVVRPHVNGQVFLPRTCLPADTAHKQLDAQVAPHVIIQMRLAFKEASALLTLVRRLVRVSSHVRFSIAVRHEPFTADGARKRPLA